MEMKAKNGGMMGRKVPLGIIVLGIVMCLCGLWGIVLGGLLCLRPGFLRPVFQIILLLLLLIPGLVYFITGMFLFTLREQARSLTVICSKIISLSVSVFGLFLFIALIVAFLFRDWGAGYIVVFLLLLLPFTILPSFAWWYLARGKVREQFR